jgi:hypothetical protein
MAVPMDKDIKKTLEEHGFQDHIKGNNVHSVEHNTDSEHVIQHHGKNWSHHNILKPNSLVASGQGHESLKKHLKFHGLANRTPEEHWGITGDGSQHSEQPPTNFNYATPLIQSSGYYCAPVGSGENGSEQYSEREGEKPLDQVLMKKKWSRSGTVNGLHRYEKGGHKIFVDHKHGSWQHFHGDSHVKDGNGHHELGKHLNTHY